MAAVPEQGGAGDKGLRGRGARISLGRRHRRRLDGARDTASPRCSAASRWSRGIGVHAPAILLISFIPMLFIATAFYYLNKADPDCGTTFSWCTRAFGPWVGWMAGWAVLAADIIVMANLADIAGLYSWILVGQDAPSRLAVMTVGIIWMIAMTYIVYVGIEASARTQYGLLGMELLTLAIFSVIAIYKVATMNIRGEITPSLEWFNPFSLSSSALAAGVILGIFIYWGWDSTVNVNEESADPTEGPGKAAVVSTVVLLGIYVLVGVAAQAYHGVGFLKANSDDVLSSLGTDVLGSPWDKLLIIAVLTSASASCQTTILPATRSALSMAAKRAAPKTFGTVHPEVPDAERRDDLDGRHLGRLVHRAQADQRQRPLRRGRGPRHDDRVLLRHHGLRLPGLLPPRAAQPGRVLSCWPAWRPPSAASCSSGRSTSRSQTASTRTPPTRRSGSGTSRPRW